MTLVPKKAAESDQLKLVSREAKHEDTVIDLGDGVTIGGEKIAIMAGPCAIESKEQMETIAQELKKAGVQIMRGGAFKARTNPYAFQGLGEEGLKILSQTAKSYGFKTVTEILDIRDLETVHKHSDIFQIGTRNMQNFSLLKEVGKTQKPVLLKRGMSSTINEFLLAAEHIMKNGNPNVILCERGIRTFETDTRYTLALATVPLIKELSHLPIIVDPSHATGKRSLIAPMSKASIAAGADGILIDVHPNPAEALCDGEQAIQTETFHKLMEELKPLAQVLGRLL